MKLSTLLTVSLLAVLMAALTFPVSIAMPAAMPSLDLGSIGGTAYYDIDGNCIQEKREAGIPGVNVYLYRASITDKVPVLIATTVSDKRGNYLFRHLSPGTYKVAIDVPVGYVNTSELSSLVAVRFPGGKTLKNFGLALPAKMYGYIYLDENRNSIRDAGEEAITSESLGPIHILMYQGSTLFRYPDTFDSSTGYFEVSGIRPGTYQVWADPVFTGTSYHHVTLEVGITVTSGQSIDITEQYGCFGFWYSG